jgi:hypothetical protein
MVGSAHWTPLSTVVSKTSEKGQTQWVKVLAGLSNSKIEGK